MTLKMKMTSRIQLKTERLRNWMKLRSHSRLENEDSFTDESDAAVTASIESDKGMDFDEIFTFIMS